MTRTEGIDFSKIDLNFIPSSPLKSSLKETAVQTQRDFLVVEVDFRTNHILKSVQTADAATSYNLDVEESTSTESDPSFGQIAATYVYYLKSMTVFQHPRRENCYSAC